MSVQTFHPTPVDQSVTNWAVAQRIVGPFAPHAQTVPDMTVAIDAGHLLIGTVLNEVTPQNVGPFTAPASQRVDRIVVDRGTGAASIVAGTEGSANAPQIPLGKLPVARVHLLNGATAITNADILDERVLNDQASSLPVFCRATLGGNDLSAFANDTDYLVPFSHTTFNIGGAFKTSGSKFQPDVAGHYLVSASVSFAGSATTVNMKLIRNSVVNGATQKEIVSFAANSQPSEHRTDTCAVSDIVYLNGQDQYVTVEVLKAGDSTTFVRGNINHTFFIAHRIG